LPFQIGDLLFGLGDLLFGLGDPLIPFGYLLTQFLNLTLLTFDSALLFFPAWRLRVRMPTGRDLLACAPSGSRIHPPYVKRFRGICPERSARKPVRMRNDGGVNSYAKNNQGLRP
jgi:hypothetical protein